MCLNSACRDLPEVSYHQVVLEKGKDPADGWSLSARQASAVDDHTVVVLIITPAAGTPRWHTGQNVQVYAPCAELTRPADMGCMQSAGQRLKP